MSIQVTKKSDLSGVVHVREIPTTEEKMSAWQERVNYGDAPLIQSFFPELSENDREFILTGITPDEWVQYLGDPGPEDDGKPEPYEYEGL